MVPPPPQTVIVLPGTEPPYALYVSIAAVLVALFTLYRNLRQKRGEHRAAFYHGVVVENCLDDILQFHVQLYDLAEAELPKVKSSKDVQEIHRLMQEIQGRTRKISRKIAVLLRPFDPALEQRALTAFDDVRDRATTWLALQIDVEGTPSLQQFSRLVGESQVRIIALLRDGEFQQGWPSVITYARWMRTSARRRFAKKSEAA